MKKRETIQGAVQTLHAQFPRELTQDVATATINGLMWCRADAVVQACTAAAAKGGWTRDKTFLSFIVQHLPDDAGDWSEVPDAKPTMTDAELRALIEDVKADAAVKHAADGRERWVELGKMCNRSLAGLGE